MPKVLLFILISCFAISCKKEKTACRGNCVDIAIRGRVYDAISSKGFSNVPVSLKWNYIRTCFTCIGTTKNVYSGKTDRQGTFSFDVSIDTSLFNDYSLNVSTPDQSGYFSLFPKLIGKYDPQQFQSVNMAFYPKANLTLRLHRTQTDVFEAFSVYHYFNHTDGSGDYTGQYAYLKTRQEPFGDTVIQVETAADVMTKIKSMKSYSNGTVAEQIDSVVYKSTSQNVFDIYY